MSRTRRGVKSREEVVCWDGDARLAAPFCPGRAVEWFPSLHLHLLNQGKAHSKLRRVPAKRRFPHCRVSATPSAHPCVTLPVEAAGVLQPQAALGEGGAGTSLLASVTARPFSLKEVLQGFTSQRVQVTRRRWVWMCCAFEV